MSLADATAALQQALDVWNAVPTSYIDMHITGTTANPGFRGFDMINEITFRADAVFLFGGRASSTTLIRDMEIFDGDDIDGDGDADVAGSISVCQDVDGDGDIEFPEGFYTAGTILDGDVEINADAFRFTVDDASVGTGSGDLIGLGVHEFGHIVGLGHSLITQVSANDGRSASMFPHSDPFDPVEVFSGRSLATDDIAWSSFLYPEGTESTGPAALQANDVAFHHVFGIITGEVWHGEQDRPIAGASVFATEVDSGAVVASAISGTAQCGVDPTIGNASQGICHFFSLNPEIDIINGKYTLPVPKGIYHIGIEAVDGAPLGAVIPSALAPTVPNFYFGDVNLTTLVGALSSPNKTITSVAERSPFCPKSSKYATF